MKVRLTHVTRFDYSADVIEGVMEVRLGPLTDAHQRWDRFAISVAPAASVRTYSDGFGNRAHLVTVARPHPRLEVTTRAEVTTTLDEPLNPPRVRPRPLEPGELADYLPPSPMVQGDEALAALAAPHRPEHPDRAFDAARGLCRLVHERLEYRRHVTTVATRVDEVLRLGGGVCQDFAHVLIGLCRAAGIPARYVSGYIVREDGRGSTDGEVEASHAWVEAFSPTHGWRGFDATHDAVVGPGYVKVAAGRDYSDVPPTRGSFRGDAAQRLTVRVETQRVE